MLHVTSSETVFPIPTFEHSHIALPSKHKNPLPPPLPLGEQKDLAELELTRLEIRHLANAMLKRLRLSPKIHTVGSETRLIIFGPGRTSSPFMNGTGYYAFATQLEPRLPELRQFAMLFTVSAYHRLYASLAMTYRHMWDKAVGERWRTKDEQLLYLKGGGWYVKSVFKPHQYPDGEWTYAMTDNRYRLGRDYSKAALAAEMMLELAVDLINEDNGNYTIVEVSPSDYAMLDVA